MQINRENYEAYMLDYWEGNLDQEGWDELALFFRNNPDLKDFFVEYDGFQLEPDEKLVFNKKESLKKTEVYQFGEIHQDNYEQWIIASQEGDLTLAEKRQFDKFVAANPQVKKEIALFGFSVLKPDESIVYQSKESLKRSVPFLYRKVLLWPTSIAAMLIIIFGIYGLLKNETQTLNNQSTVVAEEIAPLEEGPAPEINNFDKTPLLEVPVEKAVSKLLEPPLNETEKVLLADAGKNETMEDLGSPFEVNDDFIPEESIKLISMEMIDFNGQLSGNITANNRMTSRTEMSSAFEYMMMREVLNEELAEAPKEKSTLGKIFANLGGKLFNDSSTKSSSILEGFSERGIQSFNEIAQGMPVYRESDEAGRKQTYLALNENLKLRISKNKYREKTENRKGIE